MSKSHHMTPPLRKKRTVKPPRIPKHKIRKTTQEACRDCPALCCHDLAVIITRPKTKDDIEYYRWHLQYDTVSIALSRRRWYLVVKGRCMYLDDNNLCTIYDRRPTLCRRHSPPDCEKFSPWYDLMISTPEELDEFIAEEKARKKRKNKAAGKKKGEKKKPGKKKNNRPARSTLFGAGRITSTR